jgi:alkylation response protein AidB-like acyl-CoA dehydrogenase
MLTLHAAESEVAAGGSGLIAMAKLAATRAALQAVETALRITGPEGFVRGALLERLMRDARALTLMMGNEDELRAIAAQAVLPG